MSTAYLLHVAQPEARRIEIELSCETRGAAAVEVRLPVWTPGSYLVREHQRHVDGLEARDELGRALAVEKTDKQTWRVSCASASKVSVRYRLHCFELTVRTNHVDPTHAFINPSAACAFFVGREGEPCRIQLQLPPGWQTWVALANDSGGYRAENYDELADSPFELGPLSSHAVHEFLAQGVPHQLVVWGKGDFDPRRVIPDIIKIIDAEAAIFGGLPYQDAYLFQLHLNDRGRGGLEHRRSCTLLVPRFSFVQRIAYEDFLQLVAHEFFHLWNVKRIRPAAFTPYRWTEENHTRLLWAMEGLTSTYEVMALRRAGLVTPKRFLEIWAERITSLWRTPGRLRTSLSQASFDAWIKHYRPDESTANTTVSYYLKGGVVGFLLDLEIRRRSNGACSLDDVFRALFSRHGGPPGVPEEGVERAALELSPGLEQWFDRALRSTDELDLDSALGAVGLRAVIRPPSGADDKGSVEEVPVEVPDEQPGAPGRGYLGATLRERGAVVEVGSVAEGSPAQRAGIAAGDEIVAVEGYRTDLRQRLIRTPAGQTLRFALFRMDELIEVTLQLAPQPRDTITLAPDPAATPAHLELRARWLGAPWP